LESDSDSKANNPISLRIAAFQLGLIGLTIGRQAFEVTKIDDNEGYTTSATASAATLEPVDIGNGATQLQTV
jgi:hypothetical protein